MRFGRATIIVDILQYNPENTSHWYSPESSRSNEGMDGHYRGWQRFSQFYALLNFSVFQTGFYILAFMVILYFLGVLYLRLLLIILIGLAEVGGRGTRTCTQVCPVTFFVNFGRLSEPLPPKGGQLNAPKTFRRKCA